MPAEARIDLSLVVPCFNEAPHLRDSVAALLETLDRLRYEHEIIFVDDCSRDDTLAIARELATSNGRCRVIAHERNRGRGAAVKTGFAAARGRIVGFLDIDLEIGPHYIAPMVARIDQHGADMVVASRTNALTSLRAVGRTFVSHAYQLIAKLALHLEISDTESGCKFFNRATASRVVLGCEDDHWFFDTEVVARALLGGLRVDEVPVLFRRADKPSTVRLVPDAIKQVIGLHRFRRRVGLALSSKSPVYWSAPLYDRAMDALCGPYDQHVLAAVAARIRDGASVVDVCCGTGRLGRAFLRDKGCDYLGLDFNGAFVRAARRRGLAARQFDLRCDEVPPADFVVLCSSLYQFEDCADEVLAKLTAAARDAVLISEPVVALGSGIIPPWLRDRLTNPGTGDASQRHDLDSFAAFARAHGATELAFRTGDHNAVAVFPGRAASVSQEPPTAGASEPVKRVS
jgi:glycosyltransferase involved in cell wall biosynthesis